MRYFRLYALSVILLVFVFGCSQKPTTDVLKLSFEQMVEQAKNTDVSFYMWGGDARINEWVDGFVADEVETRYDIKLDRVPEGAEAFVNKLITEKQAGRKSGSIDLVWINGENFKNAREADVLLGPYTDILPNYNQYVDKEAARLDFGYPVNGYEAPYGRAQFVFEYDSAVVDDPPSTFAELSEWIRTNPGRFTYPQPPSFTGSAFIRQVFYAVTGGHEQYLDGFDETLYQERVPALWEYLNEIEPYLWQQGTTYPKDKAPLDTLFQRNEISFTMSYHQADAYGRILTGRYPETVRTFVMEDGSLYNTHYTAVPFNAPNPAGGIVVSNFLMSPQAQYSKNLPENWGDFTVLDLDKLDDELRNKFKSIDLGKATVSHERLDNFAVPEIPSRYLEELESGWVEHVLRN